MDDQNTSAAVATFPAEEDNTPKSVGASLIAPNRSTSFSISVAKGGYILRKESWNRGDWNEETSVFTSKEDLVASVQTQLESI